MSTDNPKTLTAEIMQAALRDLGEQLRERGDRDARLIEKCADAVGLTYRKAKSYWYGEKTSPDRVHFNAIKRLLSGEAEAPSNELQELRDRLDRLEALLDEERARNRGAASSEDWSSFGKFGRIHSPVA